MMCGTVTVSGHKTVNVSKFFEIVLILMNYFVAVGTYTWPDGSYTEGEFCEGAFSGKHTAHYANGSIFNRKYDMGKQYFVQRCNVPKEVWFGTVVLPIKISDLV